MIEVKDIAEYEDSDSELAKYTISKLSSEKKDLQQRIDKAIEYIEKYVDNECIYKGMIKKHNNKDTLLNILRGEE